ncbi:MnhB domain-containing protein [Candidatus Omnitrophota bacterium]
MSKEHEHGMSVIVKTITRLTVGLILLYGIYIVAHGHVSPGGGFAGGVIIALSFVHLMLAYGKDAAFKKFPKSAISFFESFGALLFLTIALVGFIGGFFFLNILDKGEPFTLFSAGIIPLCNIAISLKVGAGLFAIFVALTLLKLDIKEKEK